MDVELSLNGSGLQFVTKVTLFQATQIMAFISKPESSAQPLVTEITDSPATEQKMPPIEATVESSAYESPRQAIDALHAKTNGQKIVAIAMYLGANSQNSKILEHKDVLTEFANAGEPTPALFSRDLKDAISAGYIYPVSKKSFRLLSPTDKIEQEGFKKVKRKRTVAKTVDGEKAVKQAVRPEVINLSITTTLEGHIDYFDSPTKADQILWILSYAKANGLPSLNRLEVIYVSSKIGGDINSKFFASANASNIKNGYISSSGQLMSITIKGEHHFEELNEDGQ